jgi:hypothetical protein
MIDGAHDLPIIKQVDALDGRSCVGQQASQHARAGEGETDAARRGAA